MVVVQVNREENPLYSALCTGSLMRDWPERIKRSSFCGYRIKEESLF